MVVIVFASKAIIKGEAAGEVASLDNIERLVLKWAVERGYSAQKKESDKFHFHYDFKLLNSSTVTVIRSDKLPEFLTFAGKIRLNDEHKNAFLALPEDGRARFAARLTRDLAIARIGFSSKLPDYLQVESSEPITSALTEARFVEKLSEIDSALILISSSVVLEFAGGSPNEPPLLSGPDIEAAPNQ